MLNARFTPASGGESAATAYRDNLDVFWGYPRGHEFWNQHFADVVPNLAAKADPLDPLAAWAVDISCAFSPAETNYEDESLWVFALDPAVTALVPFPADATTFDLDMNSPEWTAPFGGP